MPRLANIEEETMIFPRWRMDIRPGSPSSNIVDTANLMSLVRVRYRGIWYLVPVRLVVAYNTDVELYRELQRFIELCYRTYNYYILSDEVLGDERFGILEEPRQREVPIETLRR